MSRRNALRCFGSKDFPIKTMFWEEENRARRVLRNVESLNLCFTFAIKERRNSRSVVLDAIKSVQNRRA
jgi:hypothetical protein